MPIIKGLGWTFDTVSDTYEKFRPGYPADLYRKLFDYAQLSAGSRAIEVGIGAGQATGPILQSGCSVTAVEPGVNFCAKCREKFSAYPGFTAIEGKFEDVALDDGVYDLLYSASAFHWVPEEIGYTRAFALLKSGGTFARFANHPFSNKGNPDLANAIQDAYGRYYYPFHKKEPSVPKEFTAEEAVARADIALRYGFTDVCHALFERQRVFTAEEYIALLSTYSDHIVIDQPIRERFFAEVADAINSHGGTLTIYDTIDLQMARKP